MTSGRQAHAPTAMLLLTVYPALALPALRAADSLPKGGPKAPGRQFIEDTYLQRKRRRERYK